jgi:hypothetical protein
VALLLGPLDVRSRLAFLHALGALDAPLQAGDAAGDPLLVSVGGAKLLARALRQGRKTLGVFAERHQRLVAHFGIVAVAQVGSASALLAFGRRGAVRLLRIALVRRQVFFGHGLLNEGH